MQLELLVGLRGGVRGSCEPPGRTGHEATRRDHHTPAQGPRRQGASLVPAPGTALPAASLPYCARVTATHAEARAGESTFLSSAQRAASGTRICPTVGRATPDPSSIFLCMAAREAQPHRRAPVEPSAGRGGRQDGPRESQDAKKRAFSQTARGDHPTPAGAELLCPQLGHHSASGPKEMRVRLQIRHT